MPNSTRSPPTSSALPANADDEALDEALAWAAVRIAVARHAGTAEIVQTVHGPVTMQRGKDLTGVKCVIGTGGPLAHGATPAVCPRGRAWPTPSDPFSLRPPTPALLLDTRLPALCKRPARGGRAAMPPSLSRSARCVHCKKGMRMNVAVRSRSARAAASRSARSRTTCSRECARRTSRAGRPARSSTSTPPSPVTRACRGTSSSRMCCARPRSAGAA